MKLEEILDNIWNKINNYRKEMKKSELMIVVSKEIYYEIANGYYSDERKNMIYPFFPNFAMQGKERYDKLFGLPLAILNTTNKNFLEVYVK
jgi:hypothetical protein